MLGQSILGFVVMILGMLAALAVPIQSSAPDRISEAESDRYRPASTFQATAYAGIVIQFHDAALRTIANNPALTAVSADDVSPLVTMPGGVTWKPSVTLSSNILFTYGIDPDGIVDGLSMARAIIRAGMDGDNIGYSAGGLFLPVRNGAGTMPALPAGVPNNAFVIATKVR